MTTFDYAGLSSETRIVVQQRTGEIKSLVRRSVSDIIEIGSKLADVKTRLDHGQFGGWLETEFQWSQDTAGRFMRVAAEFGQIPQIADFAAASALYLLSAPSTPEPARREAIERAQAGERVTVAAARQIIDQHSAGQDEVGAAIDDWLSIFDDPQDGLRALLNGDRVIWSDLKTCLPPHASKQTILEQTRLRLTTPDPAPETDGDPVTAAVEDWLGTFTSERQRELAIEDAARNGAIYQPALRSRLPSGTTDREVRRAARSLRSGSIHDGAPAVPHSNGAGKPTPLTVQPPAPQPKAARDLSLEELRAALLDLLTLPASASNSDILAAVGTLQAAFEVNHV